VCFICFILVNYKFFFLVCSFFAVVVDIVDIGGSFSLAFFCCCTC
jgi:hypothetical protein